mgnify:FL=1
MPQARTGQSRQALDGMMRNVLQSSSWLTEMIAQAARGCVEAELEESRKEIQQLQADLAELRADVESKDSKSWEQDKLRLDKDIEALRTFVQQNSDLIWTQITHLGEKIPQEASRTKAKSEEDQGIISDEDRKSSTRKRDESKSRRKPRRKPSSERRKRPGRRRSSESSSDGSGSSSESDVSLLSETEDIRVADRHCRKAMSVETYRLDDRSTERSSRSSTNKLVNNVRHLFTGDPFDGSDPVTVINFLEELKSAFDEADLGEGDAKHLVKYFLSGEASSLFKGLGSRDRSSYPRILRWLLRTYVRETMLQDARENFLTRTQRSNETELDYSKELRALARRCGGMIPERDIVHRFIRGLQPAIRTQVQMQVKRDTPWPTAVALASDYGNSHRDAMRASKSRDDARFLPSGRRRSPEAARTLAVSVEPERPGGSSSEDDELLQFGSLGEPEDGNTLAVLPPGPRPLSRVPSHFSMSSGGGSSGTYQTARGSFSPASVTYVPPREERKVLLPPGIPFPTRQPSTNPKQVCWGCGLEGHFLSGCKTTDPRLIEIALDGLRARKRERAVRFPPMAAHPPRMPMRAVPPAEKSQMGMRSGPAFPVARRRVFLTEESDAQVAEIGENQGALLAKEAKTPRAEVAADPPAEEDKLL